jgi:hypothetical protein
MVKERNCVVAAQSGCGPMLTPILEVRFLLLDKEAKWRIGGAGTTIVNGTGVWHVHDVPTGIAEPLAPIHIFAVDEKPLVKQSNVINESPVG